MEHNTAHASLAGDNPLNEIVEWFMLISTRLIKLLKCGMIMLFPENSRKVTGQ